MRNLLSRQYGLPPVGAAVNCPAAEGQASQPAQCSIEQEGWAEIGQHVTVTAPPFSAAPLSYSLDGAASGLDRAVGIARRLVRGYNFPLPPVTATCALFAGSAQLNLSNGNLVISFRLPSATPADPPLIFYYNSFSRDPSEYGYGWTGLYRQYVTQGWLPTWLESLRNTAGKCWNIVRDDSGRVETIWDPYGQWTTFTYGSGYYLSVGSSRVDLQACKLEYSIVSPK